MSHEVDYEDGRDQNEPKVQCETSPSTWDTLVGLLSARSEFSDRKGKEREGKQSNKKHGYHNNPTCDTTISTFDGSAAHSCAWRA
jgi:hypothetical protein